MSEPFLGEPQARAGIPRLRLGVLAVVVLSLFSTLFARLWYLQVVETDAAQVEADDNQVRVVYEPAQRGRILDARGRVIVENRPSEVVTVERDAARRRPDVMARLSRLLGVPVERLQDRVEDSRYSRYRGVPLAEDVPEAIVVHLREYASEFPGVEAARRAVRQYPHGSLAAHLLGYVGEITEAELDQREGRGYRLGDDIGKSGVEREFDEVLRGQAGVTSLQVDAAGRVVRTLDHQPPVTGLDLQLTIDLDAQWLTEQSLKQGLEAARGQLEQDSRVPFVAPAGSAVVLDPRDGSVVALANYPTYEPAAFVNGVRPDVFAALQRPAGHFPLLNRAVQSAYAPGSTFKLVTSVAALNAGLVVPETVKIDRGSIRVGDRSYRNADSIPYGQVDLRKALTVSSDVYYYELGRDIWLTEGPQALGIQQTARDFGLGQRTGVALDGETSGRVPDEQVRKQLHDRYPKAFPESRWFTGDNVLLAIGQGELGVTPLQLASTYATFANGGTRFRPRLASRSLDRSGAVVRSYAAEATGRVTTSAPARRAIIDGLVGVLGDPKGTAHSAFSGFPLPLVPVAGKTGTAQVTGKQDTAVFTAFAPVDNPTWALAVVMEESGNGGSAAAPVARRVLEGLAGIPPSQIRAAVAQD